jgi:hypothetical protein
MCLTPLPPCVCVCVYFRWCGMANYLKMFMYQTPLVNKFVSILLTGLFDKTIDGYSVLFIRTRTSCMCLIFFILFLLFFLYLHALYHSQIKSIYRNERKGKPITEHKACINEKNKKVSSQL